MPGPLYQVSNKIKLCLKRGCSKSWEGRPPHGYTLIINSISTSCYIHTSDAETTNSTPYP